jgi:hypothetical protein
MSLTVLDLKDIASCERTDEMKAFASNIQVCHNIPNEQKRMTDEALHSDSTTPRHYNGDASETARTADQAAFRRDSG